MSCSRKHPIIPLPWRVFGLSFSSTPGNLNFVHETSSISPYSGYRYFLEPHNGLKYIFQNKLQNLNIETNSYKQFPIFSERCINLFLVFPCFSFLCFIFPFCSFHFLAFPLFYLSFPSQPT